MYPPPPEGSAELLGRTESRIIVGDEDWDDIGLHTPIADPAYSSGTGSNGKAWHHGRGVAKLSGALAKDGWCSAALVGRDLLLTAAHCVFTAAGQQVVGSKTAVFGLATGAPYGPTSSFLCSSIVAHSFSYDAALLRCSPNAGGAVPGESWEILPVRRSRPSTGSYLYLPSVNCRTDETCFVGSSERLLLSPGGLAQTTARYQKCEIKNNNKQWQDGIFSRDGIAYSCDTFGGSSGAPVFLRGYRDIVGINSFGDVGASQNYGGSAFKFLEENDATANWIFDQAEERPHLLWTRPSDGMASLWRLNDADQYVSSKLLGAKAGYLARAYSRANSNAPAKLFWSASGGGTAIIQYLTVADNPSGTSDRVFGPYASHWMPMDYERISSSDNRLLWTKTDDGAANLWRLDANDNLVSQKPYAARGAGWMARAYVKPPGSNGRLLWTHTSSGWTTVEIWALDANDNYSSHVTFGPYFEWYATGYDWDGTGTRRLLWNHPNGTAAIWKLNAQDQYMNQENHGPSWVWQAEDWSHE